MTDPKKLIELAQKAGTQSKGGQPFQADSEFTTTQLPDKMETYDFESFKGFDVNEIRAERQPNNRALLNSAFQIGTTIVGDTIGGIGYLGEVKDIQDIVQGTETEWGNWLTNIGDNIKEWGQEVAPVYASQEALEGFKPWDKEWWATNIPSIGSTVALMLPAAGAAGITSKLLGRAGNAAKIASRLSTTQKVLPGISAAITSRHIENMMEGKEVFDTIYNKALQEGKSEEEARGIAGRAASTSYNTNYVNLLTDIPQYLALGGFKFGKGAAKTGLKAQVGDYASQMGQEALEEATQFVIGQEAERQGLQELYGEDGTSFGQRLSNYLKNPQLWTASFFGAIGGGVFQGIGKLADTLTATDRQEQSAINITDESIEQGDFERPKQTLAQLKQTNPEDLAGVTPEEWNRNIEQAEALLNHTEQTYNSLEGNPNRVELTKLSRDAKLVEQKNNNALIQLEQIKANFKDTKSFDAHMNKLQLSALSNVTGDEAKSISSELNKQLEGIEDIDTSQFRAYLPQMRKIAKELALNKIASSKIDEQIQSYEDPAKAEEREKQQKQQEQKLEKQQYQARLKQAELATSPDELDRLELTPEDKSRVKQEKIAEQRKEAPVKPKSFESVGEVASYFNERYNNRPFLEESELAGRTREEQVQAFAKKNVKTVEETPTQEVTEEPTQEPVAQDIPDGTRSFYETKTGKQQDVVKEDGIWRRLLKNGRVGTEVKNENQIEQANENSFVKSEEIPIEEDVEQQETVVEEEEFAAPSSDFPELEANLDKEAIDQEEVVEDLPQEITEEDSTIEVVREQHDKVEAGQLVFNDFVLSKKVEGGYKFMGWGKPHVVVASVPNAWTVSESKTWQPVKGKDGLPVESSWKKPHIDYDTARNLGKLYPDYKSRNVFLEIAQDDIYKDNADDIVIYTAMELEDGSVVRFGILPATNSVQAGFAPTISAIREKVYTEYKNATVEGNWFRSSVVTNVKEMTAGKFYNTKTRFNPSDLNQPLVLGVGVSTSGSPALETNGEASELGIVPTPGAVYMQVQAGNGENVWTRLFTKKLRDTGLIADKGEFEVWESLIGFREGATYLDVVRDLFTLADNPDVWKSNWKDIRTELQSIVRFTDKGRYMIDFRENLPDVVAKYGDSMGYFNYLVNKYDLTDKVVQINTREVNKGDYNQRISKRLSTTINVNQHTHSPVFIIDTEVDRVESAGQDSLEGESVQDIDDIFGAFKTSVDSIPDMKQAVEYLSRVLPNVPVEAIEQTVKIGNQQAYGYFSRAGIELYKGAGLNTAKHEAGHTVFSFGLTDRQKSKLLKEAKTRYTLTEQDKARAQEALDKLDANQSVEEYALIEKIMEEFESYIVTGQSPFKSIFKRLLEMIKMAIGYAPTIESMFYRIDQGLYKNINLDSVSQDYKAYQLGGFRTIQEKYIRTKTTTVLFDSIVASIEARDKIDTNAAYVKALSNINNLFTGDYSRYGGSIKQRLEKHKERIKDKASSSLLERLDRYISQVSEPWFQKHVVKQMSDRGIKIKYENETIEGDDTAQENWQKTTFQYSPLESVSNKLRRVFNSLPMVTNVEGPVVKTDDLGLTRFFDGSRVYADLQTKIGFAASPEHMNQLLSEMTEPHYEFMYSRLTPELRTELWYYLSQKNKPEFHDVVNRIKYDKDKKIDNYEFLSSSVDNKNADLLNEAYDYFINSDYYNNGKLVYKDKLSSLINNVKKGGIADVLKANKELFGFNEQVLRGIDNINSLFESAMNGIAQGDLTFNDRQVKNLVKKVAEKYPNTYQSSHLNIEGEKQYEWINASYLGKVVSRLNAGLFDWGKYDLDPMYSHLINTGVIDKDAWSKVKWAVVGGIKHRAKGRGTKYSSFSDRDSAIALLSMYENGFFNTSILSDAPVLTGLKLPKHKTITAINKLYELANAEYIRNTKSVDAHKSKFGKYSAGYEFFDGDQITRETISQDVDRRARELGTKLKSLGLIENNKFTFNQQSATFADLREIVANYQLNESLVILMTQGDPAFYKGSADFFKRAKEVWSSGQYLDTTAYYVDPQGNKIGYPTDGMYNVGVLKDIKEPSIHVDEYKKALLASGVSEEKTEKIVSEYGEVDLADGQGIIDIYTYRLREIGENRWGHAKEFAYRLITKGISSKTSDLEAELELFLEGSNINKADVRREVRKLIFQPIKPFYFAHHLLENVLAYPVQNKDSEYLLTPRQAEGNPELEKMLTKFGYSKTDTGWQLDEEGRAKKQYTDKFVFESGIKTNFGDQIGDLDSYTNVPFYWQDYRRQMETPEHYRDVDNRFGSQIMKLMVSDLPESLQPLRKEYEQIIKEDIERSLEQLNNRFKGLDATIDREKILNMLREEIVDRGLGDQYLEALEEIEGNTKLPLFHPLHSYRIESIVNSLYKNNITKQSFIQGVALYNVSSYGLAKKPKVVVENNRIKHVEVYAPVYTKALEKYRKEDGSIDVNDVPEEYLTGLVYRIPTEDKYSMFNIKIIGFTDDIAGGQIIMPPDVTTIAGLDYDIDKVFGFFKAVENPYTEAINRIEEEASRVLGEQDIDSLSGPIWDGILSKLFDSKDQIEEQAVLQVIQDRGKDKVYQTLKEKSEQWEVKAQSDNRKLEIMQSILSDPSMVENFLTPGGFDQIIDVVKTIKKVKEQAINENLSINNIADTITVINRMNTGKALVGIAANYNAARALWQGYNLTMNSSFVFNDNSYNNLSASEIDGLRPSRSLAEVLAAAVDNGKDPLAEFINFNTFTADTALAMLSTGIPMKTVAMFMSQPLIKKYTRDYFNNGEVAPDYTPEIDDSFKPSDITDSELKKGLSDMDLATEEYVGDYDRQQKMLKHFLYYMELAKPVSKLVQATKIPDSGTGPTVAANLSKISQYTDTINRIGKSINNAETYLKANNHMNAFYNSTFLEAQNTFKELGFPDYTANAFKAIVNKLENLKGEPFSPKDFERLTTHFIDYLSMGFPKFKEKLSTIEKNTLDSLRAYKDYLKDKGLTHSFVDRLIIQDDIIRFKGVTGIDNQEEQFIRELWDEMLKDSTPINGKVTVQTVAENLVYYSFFRSGFRTAGREGFSQLIPVDFFAYLESDGQSFNQYITNQVNNINNPVHEVFVNQYIRNNYERLSYIPEVEVEIVNNKPMTKDLTAPKYVKNDGKLYEHNKGYLQLIPALGLTKSRENKSDIKLFYEYYTGVEDPTSIFNKKPITPVGLPKVEEQPSEQTNVQEQSQEQSWDTMETVQEEFTQEIDQKIIDNSLDISKEGFNKKEKELQKKAKEYTFIGGKITRGDWLRSEILDVEFYYRGYPVIDGNTNETIYVEYIPTMKISYKDRGKVYKTDYNQREQELSPEVSEKENYQKLYNQFYFTVINKNYKTSEFTQGIEEIIDTAWLNYGPRINAKRVAAGHSLTTPDKFAESAKKMIESKGVDYFNELMKKCYS